MRHGKGLLSRILLPRTRLDSGVQYTIVTLTGYSILALGVTVAISQVTALSNLGYIVAALSIGIGFGLQEVILNFISGLILLFERPLKVGDLIEVGGDEGVVQKINIRSTTVQTRDNLYILVPNKDFITQTVRNFVYTDPTVRVHLKLGVKYGTDTALVRETLLEVVARHGKVLRHPKPEVWFVDFGESSLDFEVLFWVEDPSDRQRIASDVRFATDAAFRRAGIEIPFPQRDLHLKTVDASIALPAGRPVPPAIRPPAGTGTS